MATLRPFTYNPSPNPLIPGTEQVGELAIGIPTSGFTNSPTFWNGPDEDLGYVIATQVPTNDQPNPVGIPAAVGFFRTPVKTENDFVELAEYVSIQNGTPQNFTAGTQASIWLTNNGYWNSFPIAKNILFLGDTNVGTVASNISSYLTATGNSITYSAVTMGTTFDGNGGITTANYDAVFIYTNGGQTGSASLGTAIQNYVNSGGNVISGVFLWNVYSSGFPHSTVTAFDKTDVQSNSVGNFSVVTPSPITNGIGTSLPASFSNGNPTLSSGAQQFATFTNGVNCLAVKTVGSSTLVSINAWPANISTSNSTICKMFGNAILYATGVI